MSMFALKYRPTSLDEMIGQTHLLGENAILSVLVNNNTLSHLFFYGPPGCGKTTLAKIIASQLERPFYEMNATSFKIDNLRQIFKEHTHSLQKPLIFIDEVHRLSKNQQEVLLPFMENHTAIIMGASTENPHFSLTAAIRSRSHIFELYPIDTKTLHTYVTKIIANEKINIEDEAKQYLIDSSNGDVRAMLNLLETATAIGSPIVLATLKAIRPHAMQTGSSENENHYNLISAMIKSIRGSDIDASIYYLARLIEGGEPPSFIARRLCILASEDIGNANPPALNLASSTLNIVQHIGYPEARIPLAQLVIYLASCPKSNSAYKAINTALFHIQAGKIYPIPHTIKSNSKDYLNPHDYQGWVKQAYLSHNLKFYQSQQIGFEKTLCQWQEKISYSSK